MAEQKPLRAGLFRAVAAAALATVSLVAAPPARAQQPGPPPLIDRELFFGDPEIAGAQLSPDGKFIAFLKPYNGTRNIWVKRAEEPFSAARPVTNDTKRPISGYFWSRDARYILYVQDQGGDENYNVYAVDPIAKPAAGQDVPPARNLTEAKGARAAIYGVPETEPDALYIGLNERDKAWHDLFKVKISTGERTLLRQNTERIIGWVFDNKDRLRLAMRSAEDGTTHILRVDPDGFKPIYSCGIFETCDAVRFHKDDRAVYIVTNKGESVDLIGLALLDPETGKETAVESDPMKRVDLTGPRFSEATNELVATIYNDEKPRISWKDKAFQADYELLKKKLGGREISFNSWTKDERLWLVAASSDTDPGEVFLFDRATKKLTPQYKLREKLSREHLAPMQAIRYKSSDGLEIPAYLTFPKGVTAKNLPLVVVPHGGPWGRDSWGYHPIAQFLANRGYAVLQPNFRASTGYGKRFLDAGNNEWGQKMQDDLTWGVKHLVAEGIADPKRVGILGGSYGGYATLAGLAFTPDLYAAGVSIVGPSNLITLLESIPPYWEPIRVVFHKRMGDPSTPEGRAQLERQSPLNSAAKIKTPLLVIQGANDPRVKKAESDQIVVALRERGFPVEYLVAPDEGHGFARPVNSMAMFALAEKFLAKHLGGRAQESVPPDVATRLAEITVDVNTVTLAKKVDAASVGVPKLAAMLTPGTSSYKVTIEVAGQTIPLTVKREIKEENGSWVVMDRAESPMGPVTDTAVLAKESLALLRRSVQQGPVVFEIEFKDGKATGTMTTNGKPRPIASDLGGPLFGDGAGADAVLAMLPLEPGFTATYRTFDLQTQKVQLKQVKVGGNEEVTVPAGTFSTIRLEVTSAEGEPSTMTLWVDKASRRVVKTRGNPARLNGGTITVEMTGA